MSCFLLLFAVCLILTTAKSLIVYLDSGVWIISHGLNESFGIHFYDSSLLV